MKFLLWFLLASIFGCGDSPESYEIKEKTADSAKGRDYLLNGDYIGCGVPIELMRRMDHLAKKLPDGISLGGGFDSPIFADPGIEGRHGVNAELNYSYNAFESKSGEMVVNSNCLTCHGGVVGDQMIIGLGDSTRDFTTDTGMAPKVLKMFYESDAEREEAAHLIKSIEGTKDYIRADTIGANPAINMTYALFSHRDPATLEWSVEPLIQPPFKTFPAVDVPPWWRQAKRKTAFYNAEFSTGRHRAMALAALICADDPQDMVDRDDKFRDVQAYLESLSAPRFPGAINHGWAEEGEAVFNDHCASCHGTYGPDGVYEEKVIPIDVVGTDPEVMNQQTGLNHQRFRSWGEEFYREVYKEDIFTEGKRGYVAPPLDGVWATAPYLHNGSVPDMESLLNSRLRPKYFKRSFDPKEYDIQRMGWPYKTLRYGKRGMWGDKKIYDTTRWSFSNKGHTFGDHLSQHDRLRVMEYLKTL